MTVDVDQDKRPAREMRALTGYTLDNGAAIFVPVGLRGGDHVTVQPGKAPWWRFWDRRKPFSGKVVESHMRGASLEVQQALDVLCDVLMTPGLRTVGVSPSADHVTFGLSQPAYAQLKFLAGRELKQQPYGPNEHFTWRGKVTFYIADQLEKAAPAGHA